MSKAPARLEIRRREVIPHQLNDLPSVVAGIYATRDVTEPKQLDLGLQNLAAPGLLRGIDHAVSLLQDALEAEARVVFVGDFDADGATSCATGVLALRSMGFKDVRFLVPNRFEYGYGLTPEIVAVAAGLEPDLLITVDNGISSHEGVAAARELGMSVIITDHHLPGARLPPADAIVNPNQPGDRFPSKALAGVGVIFYLMAALRSHLRDADWFRRQNIETPNLAELLDLVALGTVADLVPLDYNNRILVAQGLSRIRAGKCRAGIRALLEIARRPLSSLAASDLGYSVAPRLNAAGRLEDMALGIKCLLSEDIQVARGLARELDQLNQQRRAIEAEMQEQAEWLLAQLGTAEELEPGLCLYDEQWHQGVVGLIASRVKEHTNRPTVVFAPGDSGELKGSARSVSGLHMKDLLDRIATEHPGILSKFGGHAMAAGLSLSLEQLPVFKQRFVEQVRAALGDNADQKIILSDGELSENELGLELAELIKFSGPWGQGFPEPLFDDIFEIVDQSVVGDVHLKLRLRKCSGAKTLDAIAFGYLRRYTAPQTGASMRIVYRLDVNEFMGSRSAQLIIEHLQPC